MSGADLSSDYAGAGFGNRLGFGDRPALLVIDFVNAYFRRGSALYAGVESTVAPAERLLRAARETSTPVIFTLVRYAEGGTDGGMFFRKVAPLAAFVGDTPDGSVIDELAPRDNELVVIKQYASSFFGTSLDSTLRALDVDTLLLTGLSTSGCIRATAVDAIQLGFRPIVIADAVGDRDEQPHEASLFDLGAKYADVVPSGEAEAYLRSRPTSPTAGE